MAWAIAGCHTMNVKNYMLRSSALHATLARHGAPFGYVDFIIYLFPKRRSLIELIPVFFSSHTPHSLKHKTNSHISL
jgi:hypothetical protein